MKKTRVAQIDRRKKMLDEVRTHLTKAQAELYDARNAMLTSGGKLKNGYTELHIKINHVQDVLQPLLNDLKRLT